MKPVDVIYDQNTKIEYSIQRGRVKNIYIKIKDGIVIVKAPYLVSKQYIKEIVQKKANWIIKNQEKSKRKKQKEELTPEAIEKLKNNVMTIMTHYQELTRLYPKQYRIRAIQYAWGSCSSKGNITISAKLAGYSEEEISYVILHELCHLKYMNHSKEFWKLVAQYMPEYQVVRKKLKGIE